VAINAKKVEKYFYAVLEVFSNVLTFVFILTIIQEIFIFVDVKMFINVAYVFTRSSVHTCKALFVKENSEKYREKTSEVE